MFEVEHLYFQARIYMIFHTLVKILVLASSIW